MKQAVKHFFTKKKIGVLIVFALIGCFTGVATYRMLHAAPVYGIDTMGDLGAVRDQYAAQLSSETAALYDEGQYWSFESEYVSTMRGRTAYNVTFDDIAEHQMLGADERYRAFADRGSVYQKQSDTKPFAFYRAYLIRVGDPKISAPTIEITGVC